MFFYSAVFPQYCVSSKCCNRVFNVLKLTKCSNRNWWIYTVFAHTILVILLRSMWTHVTAERTWLHSTEKVNTRVIIFLICIINCNPSASISLHETLQKNKNIRHSLFSKFTVNSVHINDKALNQDWDKKWKKIDRYKFCIAVKL